jgi:hypothetical protein
LNWFTFGLAAALDNISVGLCQKEVHSRQELVGQRAQLPDFAGQGARRVPTRISVR